MLKSVSEFDELEVRGVMNSTINPDDRESCFQIIYHRTVANVASLLALNNRQHFQAISMLTRNLFELAVDVKLIDKITDAIPKMIVYVEVEKLRCAKKIVKYKADHPGIALDDAIYRSFIAAQGARIDGNMATLWPGRTKLDHWSGKNLKERTDLLGEPYDEIYEVEQPRLSWQVHAGITGVTGLKIETFSAMCGVALKSCTDLYEQILLSMIDEFKIAKADTTIKGKLSAAKLMPLADNRAQADELLRQLTS